MTEFIRFGDVTGFDDAEIITLDDNTYIVVATDTQEGLTNENEQQDV